MTSSDEWHQPTRDPEGDIDASDAGRWMRPSGAVRGTDREAHRGLRELRHPPGGPWSTRALLGAAPMPEGFADDGAAVVDPDEGRNSSHRVGRSHPVRGGASA